jgi:hypothetical protein
MVGVTALVAGAVAFVVHREFRARESRIEAVLSLAEAELASESVDRSGLVDALRRVQDACRSDGRSSLRRTEARLLMSLGRPAKAWEAISGLVMAPGTGPEDLWLGAIALQGIHAVRGDVDSGRQSMALGEEHHGSTGDVRSLFLAWQMAYRTTSVEPLGRLHERLTTVFADSKEGRLAAASMPYLAFDVAHRLGLGGDAADFDSLAQRRGTDQYSVLGRLVVSGKPRTQAGTLDSLLELAEEWSDPPDELEMLVAMGMIAKEDGRSLADASARLQRILERFPSFVEARHAQAIAHVGLQEHGKAVEQLQWLLRNSAEADSRRATWSGLLR